MNFQHKKSNDERQKPEYSTFFITLCSLFSCYFSFVTKLLCMIGDFIIG